MEYEKCKEEPREGLENKTLELARQYREEAARISYEYGPDDGKIATREYLEKARYLELLDRYDGWLFD